MEKLLECIVLVKINKKVQTNMGSKMLRYQVTKYQIKHFTISAPGFT